MNKFDYERYVFRLIKQEPKEKFGSFVERSRNQLKRCRFADPENHLRDQLIANCSMNELRKKVFECEMSVKQIIFTAETLELAQFNCAVTSKPIGLESLKRRRSDSSVSGAYKMLIPEASPITEDLSLIQYLVSLERQAAAMPRKLVVRTKRIDVDKATNNVNPTMWHSGEPLQPSNFSERLVED